MILEFLLSHCTGGASAPATASASAIVSSSSHLAINPVKKSRWYLDECSLVSGATESEIAR